MDLEIKAATVAVKPRPRTDSHKCKPFVYSGLKEKTRLIKDGSYRGAEGGNRTPTLSLALDFESSAKTAKYKEFLNI